MRAFHRAILVLLAVLLLFTSYILSSYGIQSERPDTTSAMPAPVVVTPGPPRTTEPPEGPETVPIPTSEPTPEPTPEPSPLPASFFDDAVFLGDSISGTLEYYGNHNDGLGEAVFLVRVDYSLRAALDGSMLVEYGRQSMRPEEAIEAAGANKLFIMLGAMGDIASEGIDKTMDNWAQLISNIRSRRPQIRIYIQSCTPLSARGETTRLNNKLVDEYNERLKTFAEENDCVYVMIGENFKDENGALPDKYCRDGYAHLRIDAGEYWAELLRDPASYSISPWEDYRVRP